MCLNRDDIMEFVLFLKINPGDEVISLQWHNKNRSTNEIAMKKKTNQTKTLRIWSQNWAAPFIWETERQGFHASELSTCAAWRVARAVMHYSQHKFISHKYEMHFGHPPSRRWNTRCCFHTHSRHSSSCCRDWRKREGCHQLIAACWKMRRL